MENTNVEYKYYNTAEILDFLGLALKFESDSYKDYPFEENLKDMIFGYGYITIPKEGIEKVVQNKISNKEYNNILDEIKMLVHIPFYCKRTENFGNIIVNLTIGFRYDKQYKYGDITKSLPEVCYAIEKWGKKTNDFYIIDEDYINEFMSNYVMDNQWGIGATRITSSPQVTVNEKFEKISLEGEGV